MHHLLKRFLLLAIVFTTIVSSNVAQQIVRGPYLQTSTPNSIIIKWRTSTATTTKVGFGLSANQLTNSVTDVAVTTEHEVKLTGLQPNTVYFYSVGNLSAVAQGDANSFFKTAPAIGSTQKIRLWAMGDMGDGSVNQAQVRDKYLASIGNDNLKTDAVLLLGDNAYPNGLDNEYQGNFFDIYQNSFLKNNVMWAVPGNHEYYASSRTDKTIPYYQIFSLPTNGEAGGVPSSTESYYAVDYGNVHLIALDSDGIESNQYRLSDTLSPQVVWLKKDLAANRQPWTIVMFHHPPHTKNSHDSDAELELALIRKFLNPILERFKVDLVLNAHSHIYERSKLIKGHYDFSNTYSDALHAVSTSSGRYDGSQNSCAYTNKTEGTIYAVVGSSGRNNGLVGPWHPAMVYTNQLEGGSLAIDIENNRLDAKWICSDGNVKDQFTVFKNVNKKTTLTPNFGTTVQLTPSWKGAYKWPDNSTGATFSMVALKDTVVTVKDDKNCLTDQFTFKVANTPRVTTTLSTASPVCVGTAISASFTTTGINVPARIFTLQLSDVAGSFAAPTVLGTGKTSPLTAVIPIGTGAGNGYKVRVITDTLAVDYIPSSAFVVKPKPTGLLSGDATINVGDSTFLNIAFTGDAPWTYSITNGITATASTNPQKGYVKPTASTTYTLSSISNGCGAGTVSGSAKIIVTPRISTATLNVGSVCPNTDITIPFTLTGAFDGAVSYTAQLSDVTGSFSNPIVIGTGTTSPLTGKLPATIAAGGGYKVRLIASLNATSLSSPSFTIKPYPTATISGASSINFGDAADVTMTLTGDSPWTYTLSDASNGTITSSPAKISIKPTQTATVTVSSIKNICGAGTATGSATITVIPRLTTESFPSFVCAGDVIDVKFGVGGILPTNTNFQVELSDSLGGFTNPAVIGSGSNSPIASTIPISTLSASKYRIRVVAVGNASINVLPSGSFIVRRKATANLTGGGVSIKPNEEAILVIQFGGDAPWTYTLSDNMTATTSTSPVVISVFPSYPTTYTIKSVSNACGAGVAMGSAVIQVIITSTDPNLVNEVHVFPNPVKSILNLNIETPQPHDGEWQLLSQNGQLLQTNTWKKQSKWNESIGITNYLSGVYFLRVRVGEIWTVRKIIKE